MRAACDKPCRFVRLCGNQSPEVFRHRSEMARSHVQRQSGYTLRAPGCQGYGSHRLESRGVGHARDIALEFVLSMTPPSQGWSSRWRRRNDHAVRGISVIDAVTAVSAMALWTSGACAAAAIRSTSVRSRQSIHHLASVTRRHPLNSASLFRLISAASRLVLIADAQLICRSVPVSGTRLRCETAALLTADATASSARFSATKQSRQVVVFSHLAFRSCWLSKPVRW